MFFVFCFLSSVFFSFFPYTMVLWSAWSPGAAAAAKKPDAGAEAGGAKARVASGGASP